MCALDNFSGDLHFIGVDENYKQHVKENYVRAMVSTIILAGLFMTGSLLIKAIQKRKDDEEEDLLYDNGEIDLLAITSYFIERSFREQAAFNPITPIYMYKEWRNLISPNSANYLILNRL